VHVQEFWAVDCVQHGDSGLLNEKVMGDTCKCVSGCYLTCIDDYIGAVDCAEYARDFLSFLLSYLPGDVAAPGALPVNLPRVSQAETERRMRNGLAGRSIVAVGHSIGGCSLYVPRLFCGALKKRN
jgi:hypothetical protein